MWNLTSTSQQNRKQDKHTVDNNIHLWWNILWLWDTFKVQCGNMERPLARSPETSETAKPHASYSTSIRNWSSRREKIIPCLTNHLWGPQQWDERNKSRFIILGILYQLLQGQRENVLTHIAFSQCNSCPSYRQLTSPRLWTLAPSSLNCAAQLRGTF